MSTIKLFNYKCSIYLKIDVNDYWDNIKINA